MVGSNCQAHRDMASLWNRYSFAAHEAPLKGLMVGWGAVYNSRPSLAPPLATKAKSSPAPTIEDPRLPALRRLRRLRLPCARLQMVRRAQRENVADRVNWTTDEYLKPDGQGREFSGSLRVDF